MSAAPVSLPTEERLRVLDELAEYPPGEQLLARLVMLDGVALSRALRARVSDADLEAGRLTLADKRHRARVLALDDEAAALAGRAIGQRSAGEPLFVGHDGRPLPAERFRRSILAAARRAGLPASLTVVRASALIPG